MMSKYYLLLSIAATVGVSSSVSAQRPTDNAKVWPVGEMKWEKDKTLPAVQSVLLWGDPASGDHGMLRKFPAGYAPPMHRHPSVERVVVISGTMVVDYSGGQTKTLGPGSYSEIPANTDHAVQCGKEADCVFLLSSSGPFAIVPSDGGKHQH